MDDREEAFEEMYNEEMNHFCVWKSRVAIERKKSPSGVSKTEMKLIEEGCRNYEKLAKEFRYNSIDPSPVENKLCEVLSGRHLTSEEITHIASETECPFPRYYVKGCMVRNPQSLINLLDEAEKSGELSRQVGSDHPLSAHLDIQYIRNCAVEKFTDGSLPESGYAQIMTAVFQKTKNLIQNDKYPQYSNFRGLGEKTLESLSATNCEGGGFCATSYPDLMKAYDELEKACCESYAKNFMRMRERLGLPHEKQASAPLIKTGPRVL